MICHEIYNQYQKSAPIQDLRYFQEGRRLSILVLCHTDGNGHIRCILFVNYQTKYWFSIRASGDSSSPMVSLPEALCRFEDEYWMVLNLLTLILESLSTESPSPQHCP
jgi:hypothetical protein